MIKVRPPAQLEAAQFVTYSVAASDVQACRAQADGLAILKGVHIEKIISFTFCAMAWKSLKPKHSISIERGFLCSASSEEHRAGIEVLTGIRDLFLKRNHKYLESIRSFNTRRHPFVKR